MWGVGGGAGAVLLPGIVCDPRHEGALGEVFLLPGNGGGYGGYAGVFGDITGLGPTGP